MSSSNNSEFVRVLSNSPALQRQFIWTSKLLERMRAAVNFPPDQGRPPNVTEVVNRKPFSSISLGFILDDIHVEYDDGTGLSAL
jgi:hypothetical protein